jgi:hypothetical protein
LDFWSFCFVKTFRDDFFCKTFFCSVFELPSLRNTRTRDKTKKVEEKLTSNILSICLGKVFDIDFLQKHFYGVFELPLPRNARGRTKTNAKKKSRKKKSAGGWVGLGFSKCTGGSVDFSFGGPSFCTTQVRELKQPSPSRFFHRDTEPSGPVNYLGPLDHLQPIPDPSCPLGPWGAGWGEISPLFAL